MKKKIIIIFALVLVVSIAIRLSFGATNDKFDYLQFKEEDYISKCSPDNKCRICFDAVKLKEFSDEELTLKTYITDVNTKTKDYSGKVSNFAITTKQVTEQEITVGYEPKKVEYSHVCENSLDYDKDNAWCYFTAENESDITTFIHSYSKIDNNIIYWEETEDDLEKPIRKLADVTTYPEITKTQIKNSLTNADIEETLTICMEGNVKLFQKVDVYPEIFGYTYKEYATWDGSDATIIYHLDETSGDIAYDDGPNEFDATINGATVGKPSKDPTFATAYYFDGNDWVNKSKDTKLDFGTGDFTVCFFMNSSEEPLGAYDNVISYYDYPGKGDGWNVQLNNGSLIWFNIGDYDTYGIGARHEVCGGVFLNRFIQICVRRNGTNQSIIQDNFACETSRLCLL